MLIKYTLILFINTIIIFNSPVKAEVYNYIVGNNEDKIRQRIDSFFAEHPNEQRVFWFPEIKGKSRYGFSIPKNAYFITKRYSDASDLYYLSKKIDNGLKFNQTKSKNIEIFISKNKSQIILYQNFFSNINAGLFLEKEEEHFGIILNKDVILSKNTLGNFGVKKAEDENIMFNAKFTKLSNNEKSEFYGNLNHELDANILNMGFGYTWFEIANQFDFTFALREQDKKVESDFYISLGDESFRIQVGLNKTKNNPKMNMFFNLNFENIFDNKNFKPNVIITSKDSAFGSRSLSLKSFRKKNLDMLWKKNIKYN